jgi:hypothetical protein
MSEYTPPMSRLRDEYVQMRAEHYGFSDLYAEEWDRALAEHDTQVRREAKVEALREAADEDFNQEPLYNGPHPFDVLNARADRIEREGGEGE